MTDSCEGANCGRSDCPCKQETPNSIEESHSTLNSNGEDSTEAEWIEVRDFSDRVVGKDGSYYDCDVCHGVGTLLCCDTCPSTFHLECLEPPLESVPPGIWQCQRCWPRDDSSASASKSPKRSDSFSKVKDSPSSSILSLGKKQLNQLNGTSYVPVDPKSRSSAADQKLPAASLRSLDKLVEAGNVLGKASEADAHSENQGKSAIDISKSGSKMGELKVYERSMRKKKVRAEEGVNLGVSSGAASDKGNEDHKDKPAHNPVEIDRTPVEEEGEAVVACPDLNERPYSGSSDVILHDKLLIPRDVSQASANGHFFSQNDELSDSLLEEAHLSNEEAKVRKERLAYLRARQKARIAKRVKKVGEPAPGSGPSRAEGPAPGSGPSRTEGPAPGSGPSRTEGPGPGSGPSRTERPDQFHGQNFNGISGPSNKSSGIVPIAATPLRMLRPEDAGNEGSKQSSEKTDNRKNSSVNLSVNNHQKRSNHNQEGFGDQFPGFPTGFPSKEAPNPECLTAPGVKRQKMGISQFPSPLLRTLPVPQPRDVYPRRSSNSDLFSGYPMPSTGYNNLRTMEVDETWSNKELDSLWIGVRRYRQGNWLQMLTDRNLCFSRGKTAKDLAKRWEKEKANHFGPQVATTDKPNKGKKRMIDIDLNVEPSLEGRMSSESSGKEKSEEPKLLLGIHIEIPVIQPVPEAGGIGSNQMPMKEAVSGPGGNGPNQMQTQEVVEISSDTVNSDSEATISN